MTRHIITTIACLTLCLCATTSLAQESDKPTKTKISKKAREQAISESKKLLIMGKHKQAIQHAQHHLNTDIKMPAKAKAQHYKVIGVAYKHLKNTKRACHFLGKALETRQLSQKNGAGLKRYMEKLKCKS